MPLLNPSDPFPQLTITPASGETLRLPDAFAGEFAVVLFNRGAWCPYCTAQLRAFQRASESLAQAGIKVAALWVDDEETTAQFTAKHGLTFPPRWRPSPIPTAAMAARAAGFALTWSTFTTPVRGTDLAGSGRPRTWRTAGWRRTVEAALAAGDVGFA